MSNDFRTRGIEPLVFRHANGWLSWQAVVGDLVSRGHPDAHIRVEASGADGAVIWAAEVEWGPNQERVTEQPALGAALAMLWQEVSGHHWIYDGDMSKRGPALYGPSEWLDRDTLEALERMLTVAADVFGKDWAVLFTYHPVQQPDQRVNSRLIARSGDVAVAGRGATLLDAVRGLFRATAPFFASGT
ncbi:MAG: hypothetical protein IT298_04170 [Chloroflexi bacterium]|jgi:hypothetical protein|nr:MAG: hypothetical protein UZ13_03033 [Chloroflexi bacterium OLB13]MBV6436672.1 hypothetical protein [Anaerolineae bacterium]MCC6564937.1 hypothetical protein [Chloroflexota bacterium]MDL1915911.1 hypothetical protein [Anaerolineae bacterium CFX4]OQY79557.1 MAG: hypothetical protein B6D42_14880 [Anaerolineae bacterium UTCFX5]